MHDPQDKNYWVSLGLQKECEFIRDICPRIRERFSIFIVNALEGGLGAVGYDTTLIYAHLSREKVRGQVHKLPE